MRIVVVYAAPGIESQVEMILAPGAVVADAVTASALIDRHDLVSTDLTFAIYGQRVRPDTPLVDGDRIELLRPLLADPKELRRHRARGTPRTEVQTRGKKDTD